jgi:hypothetical protein
MLAAAWNVETARTNAGKLKDVPEPPAWADHDAIAQDLAAGGRRRELLPRSVRHRWNAPGRSAL